MPRTFNVASQETFLHELARAEKYFSEAGKYVGLSHFIKGHLGPMGFDYRGSVRLAARLQAIGEIEIYKLKPPTYEVVITAVRIQESSIFKTSLQVIPVVRSFCNIFMKESATEPLLMSRRLVGSNYAGNQHGF